MIYAQNSVKLTSRDKSSCKLGETKATERNLTAKWKWVDMCAVNFHLKIFHCILMPPFHNDETAVK